MTETSVKTVTSSNFRRGSEGQLHLASGQRVSMRMWKDEEPTTEKASRRHGYEVVGYAVSGKAELVIEGRTVRLEPGDSWLVPAGAEHSYRILETFTAIEAASPPAEAEARDGPA